MTNQVPNIPKVDPTGVANLPLSKLSTPRFPLRMRLTLLASLLGLEALLIFVHVRDDQRSAIARWGIACVSILVAFGYPRVRKLIENLSTQQETEPLSFGWLSAHAVAMASFLALASPAFITKLSGATAILVTAAWVGVGIAGFLFACLVFVARPVWLSLLRGTGKIWAYAVTGAFAASLLAAILWKVWDRFLLRSLMAVTFSGVRLLLRPLLPDLTADPVSLEIGSRKFSVIVGGECAGWEGVGLALIFTIVWLWVSRREFLFPRALLIIPAAMTLMFGLNTVRIAALILIGNAGAPRVAISGFHSQAGWIAFNLVALGIAWMTPRIDWLTPRAPAETSSAAPSMNRTVPYLLPFAAILAAGMLSKAMSAGFEWFYALRFIAAAAALWYCRREYKTLEWRPGWLSVVVGGLVFAMWIALDHGPHPDSSISAGLAALSRPGRITWLAFRILAATVTVPLAEELAFRGFLLPRLVSADFESVDFRHRSGLAIVVSSLAFGWMHGDRWIAGTLAGVLYGSVMLRRRKIGDAVAAHAVTNALLAAWVLLGNRWYLW